MLSYILPTRAEKTRKDESKIELTIAHSTQDAVDRTDEGVAGRRVDPIHRTQDRVERTQSESNTQEAVDRIEGTGGRTQTGSNTQDTVDRTQSTGQIGS